MSEPVILLMPRLLILGPRSLYLTSIRCRGIPLNEQSGFQSFKPSQGKVFYTLTSFLSNLISLSKERKEKEVETQRSGLARSRAGDAPCNNPMTNWKHGWKVYRTRTATVREGNDSKPLPRESFP